MDRLQTMAVFVAVAEEAGFASAARRLNLSTPSVSRAVSELEARLGVRLLHRTTRSVHLTESGQDYLENCRQILSQIDAADRRAADAHAAPRGEVSVSTTALFGRMVVAPVLLDMLHLYPEISVKTVFVNRIVNLAEEGFDIAVRFGDLTDSSLIAARVGSVRRVLIASPDYLNARGRPQTPSELSDHDIIDFVDSTPGDGWRFRKDGEEFSFRPQSRLHLNSADPAISAALEGRGVSRVLSYMVEDQIEAGDLEFVLEAFQPAAVPIHVLHKEPGNTSARVRAVVDHLVRHLRNHPWLS